MKIYINNNLIELDEAMTLADILASQQFPSGGIAVALNNKVVARRDWADVTLSDGDSLIVITAVCGG